MDYCKCNKNVKIQGYQNQIELDYSFMNNKTVCVDRCLEQEIKHLWSLGIETTGCCCGHHVNLPYIGVKEEYIDLMIDMGYIIQINNSGVDNIKRMDTFFPKSIKPERQAYTNYINHMIFFC